MSKTASNKEGKKISQETQEQYAEYREALYLRALSHQKTADRCKGAFYGLIVGDALGAPFEFKERGSFHCDGHFSSGGIWQARPGEWTDDSSMALALADSFTHYPAGNPTDQLERYLNWYHWGDYCTRESCFDIGNTTRKALERFRTFRHPSSGSIDPHTSGNGALMRLAPAVIVGLNLQTDEFQQLVSDATKTTHASPESIACSQIMASMLKELIDEYSFAGAFQRTQQKMQPTLSTVSDGIASLLDGDFFKVSKEQLGEGGYAVDALRSALWATAKAADFSSAVCSAINLGGDTDTRGAITGQLAGALFGFEGIPKHLSFNLMEQRFIDKIWQTLNKLQHPFCPQNTGRPYP